MGFECRILISAEQFTMIRSNHSLDGSATDGSATDGDSRSVLNRSISPPTIGRGSTTAASNSRRPFGLLNWVDHDSDEEHATAPAPAPSPLSSSIRGGCDSRDSRGGRGSHGGGLSAAGGGLSAAAGGVRVPAPAPALSVDDLEDGSIMDECEGELIKKISLSLEEKNLKQFLNLVMTMNALFMQQNILTTAGFKDREIIRFFRMIIKIFSPNPPKRSKVPKKQRQVRLVQSESTSRLDILMKIWQHTGVQNFRCDAQKIIRGIFLATANPMLMGLIITAIQSVEEFADLRMKRTCLFLIALAAGISCDSPIVKEPQFLADFFDKVFEAIAEGMDERLFAFERATLLPPDDFPQAFANDAWRILTYVNFMFSKVPNSVPEPSRKPSPKKQPASAVSAVSAAPAADTNPFEKFDDEVLDDATIKTDARSAINAENLPEFMKHIFQCFFHALELAEKESADIVGLTTEHSLEFALLSLLHAPMQPIPAIAFTQFSSLLSMIEKVGAIKFAINHPKSADFLSRFACLVRLLRPEDQQAEAFIALCFTSDMKSFASRATNLTKVMTDLFSLFRKELLEDKRKVLDTEFNKLFPDVKLEAVRSTTKQRVKFPAASGGEAAEGETIVVKFVDIDAAEFREFQEWKRVQDAGKANKYSA